MGKKSFNWSSILSGGLTSLVGGAMNTLSQNRFLQQQARENELAFERSKELAQMQNSMNIAQWNRENEYNTPTNQMRRLKEAGLNPDLIYGNGAGSMQAASSPNMVAGSDYQPVDYTMSGNRMTMGQAVQQSMNTAMQAAQIDVLRSTARKNDADAGGQEITNKTLGQMNNAELWNKMADTSMKRWQKEEIIENIENLKVMRENIRESTNKLRAEMSNMTFNQVMMAAEYVLRKEFNEKTFAKWEKELSLSEEQIKIMKEKLPYETALLIAESWKTQEDTANELTRGLILDNELKASDRSLAMYLLETDPEYNTYQEWKENMNKSYTAFTIMDELLDKMSETAGKIRGFGSYSSGQGPRPVNVYGYGKRY